MIGDKYNLQVNSTGAGTKLTLIGTSRISRTTVARCGPRVTVLIARSLRGISAVWAVSEDILVQFPWLAKERHAIGSTECLIGGEQTRCNSRWIV
jgi:hypothetical protein